MNKLLIIILLFFQFHADLQYSEIAIFDTMVDEFLIHLELTDDEEIYITCKDGCAWKSLKFTCSTNICEQGIDQYGMTNNDDYQKRVNQEEESGDLAEFNMLISRTQQGFNLICSKGCAWNRLNFKLLSVGQKQSVSQLGTTNIIE